MARAPETGSFPLTSAALLGRVSEIRLLVERGADLEARDRHGMTALHSAAIAGHAAAVVVLLELGADAGARRGRCDDEEMEGATPLHHVCAVPRQERLVDSLEPLLHAGADPNARTKSGLTPLHLLCRAMLSPNALEALERLLDAGADPRTTDARGYSALATLADESDNPFAAPGVPERARRLLLERGAQEKELASLRLVRAAEAGDLAEVTAALDEGADPAFTLRRGGGTALGAAAAGGHLAVVRALLSRGARPDAGKGRQWPLVVAAERGDLDVVNALLEAGADPSAGEPHRRPLDVAPAGSPVETLLEERGATRTSLAAERGCPTLDMTQQVLLVKAGAADVVGALERIVSPVRVDRSVKGTKVTIGKASLLVYQLAGHSWTAVQPVSGKPAASRFDRALGVALSRALATQGVLYENSDFTATFRWELLSSGETEELYGPDSEFPRSAEEFLDRRAKELDLLVPPWPPRALAGKPGAARTFFSGERKETFAAVNYVVLER